MHLYTADLHAIHRNIIKHSKRPFASVEEMNARIIQNFRERVRDDDDLWVVGDFAHWHASEAALRAFFDQIPGRKHLLPGNHDNALILALPWHTICRDIVQIQDGNSRVTLCHYPLITWNGSRKKNAIHGFGHVHQNWPGSRNAVNLGVDLWDFKPVTVHQMWERARTLPVNPIWNLVEPGTSLGEAEEAELPV